MSKENIWVIGDIQGCYCQLKELLSQKEIIEDPDSRFWFAGDMVNRGPKSLETIEYIINLNEKSVCVLGNHDINLLAIFAGVRKKSESDTIDDILNSKNVNDIVNWLRFRPIAYFEHNHLMVHAGILPQWDIKKIMSLANEIQELLRSTQWQRNIKKIFGNKNTKWFDNLEGSKRIKTIVNAFTRIRFCNNDGSMNFSQKKSPYSLNTKDLIPWFDMPNRASENITVVFGHWSSLGLTVRENIICLDSGCVWEGNLTAMRLQDRKIIKVSCKNYE